MEDTLEVKEPETGSNAPHCSGALPIMVANKLMEAIKTIIDDADTSDVEVLWLIVRAAEAAATLRCMGMPELMR